MNTDVNNITTVLYASTDSNVTYRLQDERQWRMRGSFRCRPDWQCATDAWPASIERGCSRPRAADG